MAGAAKAAMSTTYGTGKLTHRPLNVRLANAYAEGRRSFPSTSNPFTVALGYPTTSDEYIVWQGGQDNKATGMIAQTSMATQDGAPRYETQS